MTTSTTTRTAQRTQMAPRPVGELLREWRDRRRLSQLQLSVRAEVSTRHLSFVETGRSTPSRALLLHLAEHLDLPLRARNHLLLAAGYAPVYPEHALDAPQMAAARTAVRQILTGHEPYPAVVVDRWWQLIDANANVALLIDGLPDELLAPPTNVLRLSLHPRGMAPRIVNLGQWRAHLLGRLRQQVAITADPALTALYDELLAYPGDQPESEPQTPEPGAVAVPLRLRHGEAELSFISTVATFGTAIDITLAELSIESFFPADPATAALLRARAAAPPPATPAERSRARKRSIPSA